MAVRYRWDDFVLNLDTYRLERAGQPLALEPKAFNLLALMVNRPGHLFTKQEIFEAIWPDTAVTDHALTRIVAQLRRVLGDEAREGKYIETVPTRGYRWTREVQAETIDEPPTTNDLRLTTNDERPATNDQRPATSDQRLPTAVPRRRHLLPGFAAALALATVILTSLLWTQSDTRTSATARVSDSSATTSHDVQWPVQVTTHDGLDLHPALSPHGDAIAYVSDRSGAFEIYVHAFAGTATESPLTNDKGHNVQPAWSPDGRLIAFHSYVRGGIWIIPSRGGVPRQIAPSGSNPAWSPDGKHVVFQSDEHADVTPNAFGAQAGSTIWIVGADGSGLRQLTRTGQPMGGHASPAWSRDGRHIAFTVFEAGPDNGIWLLTRDTGEVTPLQRGARLYESVFAPDNAAVYAAGGEAAIERLPFDATTGRITGSRQLIPVPGVTSVRGLSISADGRRVAFAGLSLSSQIWAQPIDRSGSATRAAFAITSDTSRRNSLPAVSPDGSKIAYMSTRGGELPNVWITEIDGRNSIQLTAHETADVKPNWSPDGKRVSFLSNRSTTPGLWSVDIATRHEELIFNLRDALHAPAMPKLGGWLAEWDLSPSMTRAAFSVMTPPSGLRTTYVGTLAPFSARAVTDGATSIGYPSWSPDERRLAVEIKEGSSTHVGVIDLESGALRALAKERGQTWVRSWSPDSRKIAVAALRDGTWSLQWIDANTEEKGVITPATPPRIYMRYPEWSPRGDVIVFERGELKGNIWFLPLR